MTGVLRQATTTGSCLSPIAVRQADVPDLATLAAAAVWDTSFAAWLVPDPQERSTVLHAWYTVTIERALAYGHIDMTVDRRSVAVWLDRTRPWPQPAHHLRRLTATCDRHAITVLRYEELLDRQRPRGPHV